MAFLTRRDTSHFPADVRIGRNVPILTERFIAKEDGRLFQRLGHSQSPAFALRASWKSLDFRPGPSSRPFVPPLKRSTLDVDMWLGIFLIPTGAAEGSTLEPPLP